MFLTLKGIQLALDEILRLRERIRILEARKGNKQWQINLIGLRLKFAPHTMRLLQSTMSCGENVINPG